MAWGKTGSTTLSSTGDDIDITDLTACKFNQMLFHAISSGQVNSFGIFNNDSGSVYAYRGSDNGGTDYTSGSANSFYSDYSYNNSTAFSIAYIVSILGEEKLCMSFEINAGTSGASNAPNRREWVSKYVPSTDADITRIDMNSTGSGDYAVGSNLSVLGSDMTPAVAVSLKVQDGSVFHESDTNKEYVLNNGTWIEL